MPLSRALVIKSQLLGVLCGQFADGVFLSEADKERVGKGTQKLTASGVLTVVQSM